MKPSRFLIHIGLILASGLCFYMFYSNSELLQSYESNKTTKINGEFKGYDLDKTKSGIHFTFRLKEYQNVFSIPLPEWKSFDFENFKKQVKKGDLIEVEIPSDSELNESVVDVHQIGAADKKFIDFEKKKRLRRTEKWLSLIFGVGCIGGILHHYRKPWI